MRESKSFKDFQSLKINNKYGRPVIFKRGDIFFIQRHQGGRPPRSINFKAYFQALADLAVKKIISFNSVGSLKTKIKIPSLMVPHDFICLSAGPTFFDNKIVHGTPRFSADLRQVLIKICRASGAPVYDKGVYLQTPGPRFETAAEVKMFSKFADVAGMTLASEVILAGELGLEIVSVCSVDNYSNGVSGHLDYRAGAKNNLKKIEAIAEKIIKT